jgi:hypothetical protein
VLPAASQPDAVDRAQDCVEIINNERHVHKANIAGAKIDVPSLRS